MKVDLPLKKKKAKPLELWERIRSPIYKQRGYSIEKPLPVVVLPSGEMIYSDEDYFGDILTNDIAEVIEEKQNALRFPKSIAEQPHFREDRKEFIHYPTFLTALKYLSKNQNNFDCSDLEKESKYLDVVDLKYSPTWGLYIGQRLDSKMHLFLYTDFEEKVFRFRKKIINYQLGSLGKQEICEVSKDFLSGTNLKWAGGWNNRYIISEGKDVDKMIKELKSIGNKFEKILKKEKEGTGLEARIRFKKYLAEVENE